MLRTTRSSRRRRAARRMPLMSIRLKAEPLEDRRMLSALLGSGGAASGGKQQTFSDLPLAAQAAISASIGRDQAAYRAAASAQGFTLANPANGFTTQVTTSSASVI